MKKDTIEERPVLDPKIEAIKEIIFGENIKEYEVEFKKITKLIETHKEDLEQKLDKFRIEAKSMLDESNKNFSLQLEEIKKETASKMEELNEAKLNRQSFGNLLKKLGEEIQS